MDLVNWVLLSIASIVLIATNIHVSQKAPEPYMDEIFHVPQTQAYCFGRLDVWDPKITTFPGFHMLAAIWGKMLHCFGSFAREIIRSPASRVCAPNDLRLMNAFLAIANILLGSNLHHGIHANSGHPLSRTNSMLTGLTLAAIPLHFFFSTLLYTDVSSLTFVLACHLNVISGHTYLGVLSGTMAVMIRQTNAVWICFVLFNSMLRFLRVDTGSEANAQRPPIPMHIAIVIRKSFRLRWGLLKNFWAISLVPVGFASFVIWNGGIVVGDKQAHKPVIHMAQLGYFFLFLLGCLFPALVSPRHLDRTRAKIMQNPLLSLFLLVSMLGVLLGGVFVHPYLIADNRHYTFYIWRRFLSKDWLRISLAPISWFGACLAGQQLLATHSTTWLIGFMACVGATIIPAGLLEFRYFLVPVSLVLLHVRPRTNGELIASMTLSMCVNVATLYLYLEKPFFWPDGSTARFMW
ncbi:hypothetical protein BSKO_01313 [Bryopsis sp. KO-2023]|nr:hypothetical protein BSKO_01313 [Bryopsis sp. KO-2023]